ncbi:MAG: HEAT repeat domain-containing protein [Planctomycetes bacterium]|nr:HEAT repeat domain-containing protein [Planctomycetota bacterium]
MRRVHLPLSRLALLPFFALVPVLPSGCSSTAGTEADGAKSPAPPAATRPQERAAERGPDRGLARASQPAPKERRSADDRGAARDAAADSTPARPASGGAGGGRLSERELDRLIELDALIRRWNVARDAANDEERTRLEQELRGMVNAARDTLEAYLGSAQVEARVVAAAALGFCGDANPVAPLLSALSDPNYGVRANAAISLGELAEKETPLEPLLRALEDPHPDVRGSAAFALTHLARFGRARELLPPLLQRLDDTSFTVRNEAVRALAVLGSPEAVNDILAKTLHDEYFLVRLNSAVALAHIKDPRAIEPLIGLLADTEKPVRKEAAYALENITGQKLGESPSAWRSWWDANHSTIHFGPQGAAPPGPSNPPGAGTPAPAPNQALPPGGRTPKIEEESSDVRHQGG